MRKRALRRAGFLGMILKQSPPPITANCGRNVYPLVARWKCRSRAPWTGTDPSYIPGRERSRMVRPGRAFAEAALTPAFQFALATRSLDGREFELVVPVGTAGRPADSLQKPFGGTFCTPRSRRTGAPSLWQGESRANTTPITRECGAVPTEGGVMTSEVIVGRAACRRGGYGRMARGVAVQAEHRSRHVLI
jgi:hypothetical protein